MTAIHQENVSSFEAIINSIKYDPEVCRWFEFFVTLPAVAAELSSGAGMERAYRDIQRSILAQRILLGAAILNVAAIVVLETLWPVLAAPFIVFFWFRFQTIKNAGVVSISDYLIRRDYGSLDALSSVTLYQLCEEYAQNQGVASLVDKIYCFDQVKRYSVLALFVVGLVIWVGTFSWKVVLGALCYYELIKAALMSAVVYRRLQ